MLYTHGVHVLQRHERAGALAAAQPVGLVALDEELLAHGPELAGEAADVVLVGAAGRGQLVARARQLPLQHRDLLLALLLEHVYLRRVQLFLKYKNITIIRDRSRTRRLQYFQYMQSGHANKYLNILPLEAASTNTNYLPKMF